jgi:hypothetical protein
MHFRRNPVTALVLSSCLFVCARGWTQAAAPGTATAMPSTDSGALQQQPTTPAEDNTQHGLPQAVPAGDSAAQPAPARAMPGASEAKNGKDNDAPIRADQLHHPTLWHAPGNIAELNLYWGQGGEKHQPATPFTFESEDKNGTNPKFDVRDANDRKWRVKLGPEARPEVVASRLLWAVGYYVNDDYVVEQAQVPGLHLSRGMNLVKDGRFEDARFARKPKGQKKVGIWEWKQNPFTGTRELNGLRVMMAVMNNWDLKDVNNAVYDDSDSGQQIFLVSDVGATFGTNGLSWTHARSKGNVNSFKESKCITRETDAEVDFATPKPPTAALVESFGFAAKEYAMREHLEWIGQNVPRQDAKWMGSLLGQLSRQQIVDAFRAGHFPADEIDAYADLVESRIQELKTL